MKLHTSIHLIQFDQCLSHINSVLFQNFHYCLRWRLIIQNVYSYQPHIRFKLDEYLNLTEHKILFAKNKILFSIPSYKLIEKHYLQFVPQEKGILTYSLQNNIDPLVPYLSYFTNFRTTESILRKQMKNRTQISYEVPKLMFLAYSAIKVIQESNYCIERNTMYNYLSKMYETKNNFFFFFF